MAIGKSIFPSILFPRFELVFPLYRISQSHSVTMITNPPLCFGHFCLRLSQQGLRPKSPLLNPRTFELCTIKGSPWERDKMVSKKRLNMLYTTEKLIFQGIRKTILPRLKMSLSIVTAFLCRGSLFQI